jgi:hypothetical protein
MSARLRTIGAVSETQQFGVYTLGENQTAHDVFAMQDELLRSEGIDPPWVPSTAAELAEAEPGRSAIATRQIRNI